MIHYENQLLDWLQLIRTDRVGPRLFWQLINQCGTAAEAIAQLPEMGIRSKGVPITPFSRAQAEAEIEAHEKLSLTLLPSYDPRFSIVLTKTLDCPPLLSVAGSLDIFNKPTVGIVGGRNCSIHGRQLAETMAREISKAGWVISSGLARGIDAHAHKGALPHTIAVLAGGVNRVYPPEHQNLYRHIAEGGAVVSEMPLSLFPGATHFPRRNRIISGLSKGIVVIEAALRSGSLITARMALDQNRDLFAVPGSPFDDRSRGCNDLIRQGATMVESAQDVLMHLTTYPTPDSLPKQQSLLLEEPTPEISYRAVEPSPNLHRRLLQDLDLTPLALDELVLTYDDPPEIVSAALLELELSGQIMRHANNRYSRIVSGM